ncbi:MAG: fumarylacetoacetate hydrolase family protein [Chloroflexota bacterium]
MEASKLDALAAELLTAERLRKPVAPLMERFPELTVDDAYAIQIRVIQQKMSAGAVVVGKKIGLTSRAMQDMFGVREPDYGLILNTAVVPESVPLSLTRLIQPRVESEICFVLKEDLKGPGVNVAKVLQATCGVMPALEIIDSRFRDWKIKIQDTVADSASNAAIILGSKLTRIEDLDLRLIGLTLERDGEVVATASGAAVLGNPAEAVAWLANRLGEYDVNFSLKAGEFIMSGSLTAALPVAAGTSVRATFDRLGSVSARFVS